MSFLVAVLWRKLWWLLACVSSCGGSRGEGVENGAGKGGEGGCEEGGRGEDGDGKGGGEGGGGC